MKKISVCIPVFNEELNIYNAYNQVVDVFKNKLKDFNYEIIFTDNHSTDKTEEILVELCGKDKNVKYIRFKSNLDYDKSILEGYKNSTGDAVIVIDCDLQDPPSIFVEFINKWQAGHDLVYGVVTKREENFVMNFFRKFFYVIMNLNSDIKYPLDAHDFRLVDRKIVDLLKGNNNLFPYVRGLTFSLSKNSSGIKYEREKRKKGESKLGIYNTITYAINALLEETFFFSKIFRRLSSISILLILIFSIINFFWKFEYIDMASNMILLILSIVLMFLTIICEYVTRIYFQIKKDQRFIYEKTINLDN